MTDIRVSVRWLEERRPRCKFSRNVEKVLVLRGVGAGCCDELAQPTPAFVLSSVWYVELGEKRKRPFESASYAVTSRFFLLTVLQKQRVVLLSREGVSASTGWHLSPCWYDGCAFVRRFDGNIHFLHPCLCTYRRERKGRMTNIPRARLGQ